jgi:hypothetical protein
MGCRSAHEGGDRWPTLLRDPPLPTGAQPLCPAPQYMRPKCHALLLDETINGPATVRLNIFQVGGPAAGLGATSSWRTCGGGDGSAPLSCSAVVQQSECQNRNHPHRQPKGLPAGGDEDALGRPHPPGARPRPLPRPPPRAARGPGRHRLHGLPRAQQGPPRARPPWTGLPLRRVEVPSAVAGPRRVRAGAAQVRAHAAAPAAIPGSLRALEAPSPQTQATAINCSAPDASKRDRLKQEAGRLPVRAGGAGGGAPTPRIRAGAPLPTGSAVFGGAHGSGAR